MALNAQIFKFVETPWHKDEITKESIKLFFGLFSALGSLDIGLCKACSAQVLSPLHAIIYSISDSFDSIYDAWYILYILIDAL